MQATVRARSALMADQARLLFSDSFAGVEPALISRAPGRTDMMGGHTDYNLGYVLTMAIDRATYLAVRPRTDRLVRAYTSTYESWTEFSLDDITRDNQALWSNYPRAVAWALQEAGHTLRGMDAVILSDVPIASGVSSSASIEVACALAFLGCAGLEIEPKELALICQRAENDFVGMRCGILDQFSSVLGRESCAVLINCATYEHQIIPVNAPLAAVVCDTARPRELVGSEYNLLRSQCEQGAQLLNVRALGEVDLETLEAHRERFTDEEIYWRCYYIVNENARVLQAAQALREGDLIGMGGLMNESFRQARDYYKISVHELDMMWELCGEFPGCYGARIVGAGFGGAMLAICDPAAADDLISYVAPRYERLTGRTPNLFTTPPSQGAGYLE